MRVLSKKTLREFWIKHKDCEQQLKSWYHENEKTIWKSPSDIKKQYPSANFLTANRIVFNIKGNRYRLIVAINYGYRIMWIKFIGTHAEYDNTDAKTI